MNAYIFQASLLCEPCAMSERTQRDRIAAEHGNASHSYRDNSDKYPVGPFPNGGGEADTPQHCDHCHAFLENPLTRDGVEYVREHLAMRGHIPTQKLWREFYAAELEQIAPLFDNVEDV